MLLNAVMCVWNEEDVIESTVRHAFAQGCSQVYVIDNDSTDNTARRAVEAGAKLAASFHSDTFDEVQKIAHINALVEHCNSTMEQDSTWWLFLDADEFPDVDGPLRIIDMLKTLPAEFRAVHGFLHNHIPTHPPYHTRGFHPADTMPLVKKTSIAKVPLLRYDRGKPHIVSAGGAHTFLIEGDTIPILSNMLAIHHFPYRGYSHTQKRLRTLLRKHEDGSSRIDWMDSYAREVCKEARSGYHERYENLQRTYESSANQALKAHIDYDFKNIPRWYPIDALPQRGRLSAEENKIANGLFFFFMERYAQALCEFNIALECGTDASRSLWLYIKVIESMLRCGDTLPVDALKPVTLSGDPEGLAYLESNILPLL